MITLYAFGRVHPFVHGETRDLRIQWALEEMELPYEVKGIDHTGGENLGPEFSAISPFNQIPILDDDGFVLSETGAMLIWLAEKSGKLIPADAEGRMRVIQWCFGALATVENPTAMIQLMNAGAMGPDARKPDGDLQTFMTGYAHRVLDGLNRHLEGRDWVACPDFTVADILMTSVLREIRKTGLMDGYPNVAAFYDRALARPAWQRTLDLYAGRLGADREAIA